MKKFVLIMVIVFVFIISSFLYYVNFSSIARTGKTNSLNTQKIRIGMDSLQVIKIMGEPFLIHHSDSLNPSTKYWYENMPLESEVPFIDFDSSGFVVGFLGDSLGSIRYITKQ